MSTSRDHPTANRGLKGNAPLGFRLRLTLLLMTIVVSLTLIALYLTQRSSESANEGILQERFQSRLNYLLGAQETREAEVSERCREVARSVRIQAALEENDVEDLYANAAIELRGALSDGSEPTSPGQPPKATFFRFLTADGKLMPRSGVAIEPWENKLTFTGTASRGQQVGYVEINSSGRMEVDEIVATPILGPVAEPIAYLVIGFPAADSGQKNDNDLKTGIWLNNHLRMPELSGLERQELADSIGVFLTSQSAANNFKAEIRGEPYLLFYKKLNPGSTFAPAYEICLYSLAASMKQQDKLRWRILGLGAVAMLLGFVISYFLSGRMSRPVEQLEEVSAQNVVRREQAEAERALTEQKYRSIFENAVEGIFLLAPDGRYLSANPAMARIFGYASANQFIDEARSIYIDRSQGGDFLRRIESGETVSNFECEAVRRDGSTIWISQNARAVRNAAGELLHAEGTLEDITGRKQAEDALRTVNAELAKALAELKATQKQIIQQERLRALGQMASGIAHDFNNSLMPVMGFSELLLAQPAVLEDRAKTIGYLEMIRTAAKDAASIVARLREFYRTNENSDVFALVNLAQLTRQAISLTQPKWKGQARATGADIRVTEDITQVPPISGDESALREVLTNLIFNAVDAMTKGGTITLRTYPEGAEVVVEIADTGGGMSEEVRQRCFEPFFTTKGDRGTGLGLAMVFGIIQRHGGRVELQTQLGKGTTFVLRFPAATAVHMPALTQSQPLSAPIPLRILLVDDEPQVREVLAAFLEVDGHEVANAHDGNEGLRLVKEREFDLIITDRSMPGMSGEQMAHEIKKFSPRMPIILLSGFTNNDEDEKMPGITIVVSKPIALPALRKAIVKAMQPS